VREIITHDEERQSGMERGRQGGRERGRKGEREAGRERWGLEEWGEAGTDLAGFRRAMEGTIKAFHVVVLLQSIRGHLPGILIRFRMDACGF